MGDSPSLQRSPVALVLIDVINSFDFPGHEPLVAAATEAAPKIHALRARARAEGAAVIYVNDHFGQWRSDFRQTVRVCCGPDQPGQHVSRLLEPGDDDFFVLKPRHSAFYATPLEVLLRGLGTERLILVGFAANICVLYTADDAHMRGFDVSVPSDCVAANSPELTQRALEHMRLVSRAHVAPSEQLSFSS